MEGASVAQAEKPKKPQGGAASNHQRKAGSGRGNEWQPTAAQRLAARSLFAAGASWRQVAARLGVAKATAEKHLRAEYEEGYEDANLELHATMLHLAIKRKNPTMLIWLSKNRMGWTDRQEQNHNGAPPPLRHELSLRVEYVVPGDARALPPPPPGTPLIEAKARPAPPEEPEGE